MAHWGMKSVHCRILRRDFAVFSCGTKTGMELALNIGIRKRIRGDFRVVGLLIVTHGSFSREIINSVELIIGKQKSVEALTLTAGEDVSELHAKIEQKREVLNQGNGVLILVDLLGGSPWNVASICTKAEDVECVSGLNMPMLLEALEGRDACSLQELKAACMRAAVEGVVSARDLFWGCCEEEGA